MQTFRVHLTITFASANKTLIEHFHTSQPPTDAAHVVLVGTAARPFTATSDCIVPCGWIARAHELPIVSALLDQKNCEFDRNTYDTIWSSRFTAILSTFAGTAVAEDAFVATDVRET